MMKLMASLIVLMSILTASYSFCEDEKSLGRLIVTPSRIAAEDNARSITSLDGSVADLSVYDAIPDMIGNIGGIDMRRRSPENVQSDVSIRGTTFEQNSVLIDGVRINDPQTGHYTMDIPLTPDDVDRVEILKGPGSSLYGPNAFGGVINIITKKPEGKSFVFDAEGGTFDYDKVSLSCTAPFGPIDNRFSIQQSRSTGYMSDTEFDIFALSNSSSVKTFLGVYDLLFGYINKDYGASNFYSNRYPHEAENTDTRFFNIGGLAEAGDVTVRPSLYLRRHWDKFQLDVNRPGWQTNYSTVYSYGGGATFGYTHDLADLSYGFEVTGDTIDSTNMKKHDRSSEGLYAEAAPKLLPELYLNLGIRADHFSEFGWEASPSVSASYRMADDVSVRGTVGRAYRIPTFTELYYIDAANVGNPSLKPESSWTYEAGVDYHYKNFKAGLTYFYRKTYDTIDWIRYSPAGVWNATNIGGTSTNGVEVALTLDKFFLSYTCLDVYSKHGYISKYVLDYLKQQISCGVELELAGFKNDWVLNYKDRVGSSPVAIVDTRIRKNIFTKSGVSLDAYFEIANLCNTPYSEVKNVAMPGRWIKSGARLKF
jgi:iron complex outermembrane receptor protein